MRARLLSPALAASLLAGCTQEPSLHLAPVTAQVTFDGKPLARGAVTLRPDEANASWHQPTGRIAANGRCEIYTNGRPGAPPGAYKVLVSAHEEAPARDRQAHPGLPRSIIPERYNRPETTPLRLTVADVASPGDYDLELKSNAP